VTKVDEQLDLIHIAIVNVIDDICERDIDEDALAQCDELIAGLTPEERKAVHERLAPVIFSTRGGGMIEASPTLASQPSPSGFGTTASVASNRLRSGTTQPPTATLARWQRQWPDARPDAAGARGLGRGSTLTPMIRRSGKSERP
jgi:hypothetical protein